MVVAGTWASLRCDHVVLAVPLWSLNAIELDAELEPAAREAIRTCTAGSYVKVLHRLRPEAAHLWERHGDGLFTLLSDSPAGLHLPRRALVRGATWSSPSSSTRSMPGSSARCREKRSLDVLSEPLTGLSAPGPLWPGVAALVTQTRAYAYPRAVAYWSVDRGRSRFDDLAAALRRPHGRVHFSSDTLMSSHSDGAVRTGQRVARTLSALLAGAPGRSMAGR